MSNTTIQIKRSIATTTPSSLANGELAFSGNTASEKLFIGNPNGGAVTAVGGTKYGFLDNATTGNSSVAVQEGGILSANAVIITNANGFVDTIKTNTLILGSDANNFSVNVISSSANSTALGSSSNNELMTSWAIKTYVDSSVQSGISGAVVDDLDDVATANTQNNDILVYDSAAGVWENHTIDGTANEVTVSFSDNNIIIGLPVDVVIDTTLKVSSNALFVNSSSVNLNADVSVTGDIIPSANDVYDLGSATNYFNTLYVANIIGDLSSSNIDTGDLNVSGSANIGNALTDLINLVGAINTSLTPSGNGTVDLGTTARWWDNAYLVNITANTIAADSLDVDTISLGNTTVNTYLTSTSVDIDGTLAAGNTTVTNLTANTLTVDSITLGNSTVNTYLTGTGVAIDGTLDAGNTTVTNLTVDNSLFVNSTVVSVNAILSVNADVIPVGNGVVNLGNTTNRFGTLFVSGNTIVIGETTLSDANGTLTTSSGDFSDVLTVSGNTVLGSNNADVISFLGRANTDLLPSANVTYSLGSADNSWHSVYAANVHADSAWFAGNVNVSGDVFVSGNLVTVNVSSVIVSDPLIYLAGNNYASDLVDIGFVGNYNDGTDKHTGVIRHASTDSFYVFKGYTPEPDANVIDINHASFKLADVHAYLHSGGLISNSSSVSITANSTITVGITANTLSLSTALGVSSGGTGLNSFTASGVFYGANSSSIGFLTGTEGQVLQVNSSGAPTFGGLDGGTF